MPKEKSMKRIKILLLIIYMINIGAFTVYGENCFKDNDGDGYGDLTTTGECVEGFVDNSTDCDDNDSNVYPGQGNCVICYLDADHDTYGDPNNKVGLDTCSGDYVENNEDCNDQKDSVYPGAAELCNTSDDNCNGAIDEGLTTKYYLDSDGDGCGMEDNFMYSCNPPSGYSTENCDCDDTDAGRFSGNVEVRCDGIDQDCNGIDECPGAECMIIPDVPLETIAEQAPPMLMFVIDNSGSMDAEIMTRENFGNFDNDVWYDLLDLYSNFSYVFTAGNEHIFGDDEALEGRSLTLNLLGLEFDIDLDLIKEHLVKGHWVLLSQWYDYNKLYYNPNITYSPWPDKPDANPTKPQINPMKSGGKKKDMTKVFLTLKNDYKCDYHWGFIPHNCGFRNIVHVKRSHYYIRSGSGQMYLVNLETDQIRYYKVKYAEKDVLKIFLLEIPLKPDYTVTDLREDKNPPSDIVTGRSVQEERQNFANWYTYYRRRIYAVKAAIAKVVDTIENAKIGFYFINNKNVSSRYNAVNQPLLPVKCKNTEDISNITIEDQSETLLNVLYDSPHAGGTPLRVALKEVGQYYMGDSTLSSRSPYDENGGECQHAFSIVLTDGFWNGSSPKIGNVDNADTAFDGICFQDSYNNTLADVAMKYYENDLSPHLDNHVPSRPGDDAHHQHMVTYSVSFGVGGTIDPEQFPGCPPEILPDSDCQCESGCPCPVWPEVLPSDQRSDKDPQMTIDNKHAIDDLWHAAVNGRGRYFKTTDATDLANSIQMIVNQIPTSGSVASISSNGPKLETNITVYQGAYNSKDWSGDLKAYGLKTSSSTQFDFENPKWSANEKMKEKEWTNRVIVTSKYGNGHIEFNQNMPEDLVKRIYSDTDKAEKIINYVRGDAVNEKRNNTHNYRNRYFKLGDIIHSSPLYVQDTLNRENVFIGSNDGMLHIFDANTGEEKCAYIPNLVFENLKNLVSQNYPHNYYVNATPTYKNTDTGEYIVGGLGKGGKGYYCLNASADFAKMPFWEFPSKNNGDESNVDMGYSYSTPYIVNSQSGWVVIFGNGYASTKGIAALYVRRLDDGGKVTTISTNEGDCNGLSTPALVDINFDGLVDYAYAGDLKGNLWKFDLTDTNPASWKIAYGTKENPKPLFQAKNSMGTVQPITSKPDVLKHCLLDHEGYLVIFGTGSYLTNGDTRSIDQQTVYAIWDWQNKDRTSSYYFGEFTKDRKLSHLEDLDIEYQKCTLLEQTLEHDYDAEGYMVVSNKSIVWYPKKQDEISHVGWYFDLPKSGERVVANPSIREGKVFIISMVPAKSKCGVDGNANMYVLNACNGGRLNDPIFKVDEEFVKIEAEGLDALPPSGIEFSTVLNNPVFLHNPDNGTDVLVFGNVQSTGNLPDVEIKSEQGRFYWKF
jgi:type IV pilus assembly protein PilY1